MSRTPFPTQRSQVLRSILPSEVCILDSCRPLDLLTEEADFGTGVVIEDAERTVTDDDWTFPLFLAEDILDILVIIQR